MQCQQQETQRGFKRSLHLRLVATVARLMWNAHSTLPAPLLLLADSTTGGLRRRRAVRRRLNRCCCWCWRRQQPLRWQRWGWLPQLGGWGLWPCRVWWGCGPCCCGCSRVLEPLLLLELVGLLMAVRAAPAAAAGAGRWSGVVCTLVLSMPPRAMWQFQLLLLLLATSGGVVHQQVLTVPAYICWVRYLL